MFTVTARAKDFELARRVAPSIKCYSEGRGIPQGKDTDRHYLIGALAEIAIKRAMIKAGMKADLPDWKPDKGYDFVVNGIKVDIKCLLTDYVPKDYYIHNLTARQHEISRSDAYIFCTYAETSKKVHICGWISKTGFHTHSTFWTAGQQDLTLPTKTGHFTYTVDTRSIKQTQLYPLNSIEDIKGIDILVD